MTSIKELTHYIESIFPLQVQESYDNSGLITGNKDEIINKILLTIDIDEKVIDEAIEKKCNLIISHHPILFQPIKSLTGKNYIEKAIIKAIKNDIAIYSAHTNVDNSLDGINKSLADLFELKDQKILLPKTELLCKIVTFVPIEYAEKVRNALFDAGAGHIGNYDSCSYNLSGEGTFKAKEGANPFVGEINKIHTEREIRIETIFPVFLTNKIINSLKSSHPYEEPAFDIFPLKNTFEKFGAGIIGELKTEETEEDFLKKIKEKLKIKFLKHSELRNKKIKKISICSGAGSFLINESINQKADLFISSEFKYNNFLDAQNRIIIVDAGHYETEIFIKNIFYEKIIKKFNTFAVEFSEKFENPVKYL